MSTVLELKKTWLATESLLAVWWRMPVSGAKKSPCLPALAVGTPASGMGEGPVCSQLALLWCSRNPLFCEQTGLFIRLVFLRGSSLSPSFFFFSLCLSHSLGCCLTLLSQIVLRVFRPGPYPKHATRASLPGPCLLVADKSAWATSPLGLMVRHVFCGLFTNF